MQIRQLTKIISVLDYSNKHTLPETIKKIQLIQIYNTITTNTHTYIESDFNKAMHKNDKVYSFRSFNCDFYDANPFIFYSRADSKTGLYAFLFIPAFFRTIASHDRYKTC